MEREVTLDLDRGDIRKAFWGYNRSEVHQLLRVMQDQLQNAKRRIVELEGQVAQQGSNPIAVQPAPAFAAPTPEPVAAAAVAPASAAAAPSGSADQVEGSLREIFMIAQRAADETRLKAERDAAVLVDEARHKAEEQTREHRAEASQLKWDIERLRLDKQKLVDEYRAFLESRLSTLTDSARAFVSAGTTPQFHVHPIVTPEEARALLDDKRDAS